MPHFSTIKAKKPAALSSDLLRPPQFKGLETPTIARPLETQWHFVTLIKTHRRVYGRFGRKGPANQSVTRWPIPAKRTAS